MLEKSYVAYAGTYTQRWRAREREMESERESKAEPHAYSSAGKYCIHRRKIL